MRLCLSPHLPLGAQRSPALQLACLTTFARILAKASWGVLLFSAFVTQAQIATIKGTVSGVSLDSTFLAEAGASNSLAVSGSAHFGLPLFITSGNERFRVGFQLIDASGAIVLLDNGAGGTTSTVFDDDVDGNADTGFPVALGFPGATSATLSFAEALNPDGVLDPYETYSVRLLLYRLDSASLRYTLVDSMDSPGQAIPHFTGTFPFDLAINAITTIQDVSFRSRSFLETSIGLGDDEAFLVDVTTLMQRFDSWTHAPLRERDGSDLRRRSVSESQ